MVTKVLVAAVLATAALPVAGASASYYVDQARAEHYVRDYFHFHVGYHYTEADCHPQYIKRAQPGYIYHRWSCIFRVGDSSYRPSCGGIITVSGSHAPGSYYTRVNYSQGACPRGTSD